MSLDISSKPEGITKDQAEILKSSIKEDVQKADLNKAESDKIISETNIVPEVPEVPVKTLLETVQEKTKPESTIRQEDSTYNKSELQQAQDNLNRYEDYVRGIISTKKMPNGKKVTAKDTAFMKSEYKRLVDARDNASRSVTIPQETVPLADNAGVIVRDKQFLLPEPQKAEAPVESVYDRFNREKASERQTKIEAQKAKKEQEFKEYLNRPQETIDIPLPPSMKAPEILMLPAGKRTELTTIPDYTSLPPKEAALQAQAEFNRINDFYQGNIPESAMERVKYLAAFADNLNIGKSTNIDMNQILKDNVYKKYLLSK